MEEIIPHLLHVIAGGITKILERNRWDDERQERGYINSSAVEGASLAAFEAEEKSGARGWLERGRGRAKPSIRHFETRSF